MYIIIVGCGRVGTQLAKLLAEVGHNVVVIDKDAASFKNLGTDFNGLTVAGDGFDVDLLKEAGVEQADAFWVMTFMDSEDRSDVDWASPQELCRTDSCPSAIRSKTLNERAVQSIVRVVSRVVTRLDPREHLVDAAVNVRHSHFSSLAKQDVYPWAHWDSL